MNIIKFLVYDANFFDQGYNFATFKKKGRALMFAIRQRRRYYAKELLKRKLLRLEEIELCDEDYRDLLAMKDLQIYRMMHADGVDFSKSQLVPNSDTLVEYPFMNALMDWHLAKKKVPSLKRLCILELVANQISDERLPHDLKEAVAGISEAQNIQIF